VEFFSYFILIYFELIESLLKYIMSLNQPGAVLIFLPGWNLIVSLLKYLRETSFGGSQYILLPLHSQIPREEQYKVNFIYYFLLLLCCYFLVLSNYTLNYHHFSVLSFMFCIIILILFLYLFCYTN